MTGTLMQGQYFVGRPFESPDLTVAVGLPGKAHRFRYRNHDLTITLPAEEKAGEDDWAPLRVTGWSGGEIAQYDVHRINVSVAVTDPPFSRDDSHGLQRLIKQLGKVAADATKYWFRVARMETFSWSLGAHRRGTNWIAD